MSSLSCVSFINAVSYSYPVAEGAPVEALSEVWPYIFCYFLSYTSGKCDILKFSVFTGALSISSLRYFPANLLFFVSRKPRSAGRWVLIFSLLSLAWSPRAKFLVCALVESLCCGGWDSCFQDFPAETLANKLGKQWGKLRAMRKTEINLIPWLWHLLCERVLWQHGWWCPDINLEYL